MDSDGKCIWEYCNEKCECSECKNCPQYKADYKKKTEKNKNDVYEGKEFF